MTQLKIWCKMTAQKMQIRHNIFHLKLLLSWNSTYVTKKRVWQVTTIIQLALCHLVTSHFQEIACNYTPKGQIRWPIFLLLLCMIVLTEITSKFPKPIIFRILVFSCHKMTLITKITWMPQVHSPFYAKNPPKSFEGLPQYPGSETCRTIRFFCQESWTRAASCISIGFCSQRRLSF